jgi:hypothetical protein
MSGSSIEDVYKRYEFNKTEPETLMGLVKQAIETGDGVKDELKRFREITEKVAKLLEKKGVFRVLDPSKIENIELFRDVRAVGIDGSLQPIEGFGGYWFVPTSCARVTFDRGPNSATKVDVTANIEKIKEHDFYGVGGEATFRMMKSETKAIMDWAEQHDASKGSVMFIDGPIVDPPNVVDKDYVEYRCKALEKCIKKNILVIGCVKRMKASILLDFIEKKVFTNKIDKEIIRRFAWDLHLVTAIFSKLVIQGATGVLSTIPICVSDTDDAMKAYRDHGIIVNSLYIQKDATSRPIRADFPILKSCEESIESIGARIISTVHAWSYPGMDIPLPVFLAHNKCEVRKGCADVLYDEIITRSKSKDPFENILNEKLKR